MKKYIIGIIIIIVLVIAKIDDTKQLEQKENDCINKGGKYVRIFTHYEDKSYCKLEK